MSKKKMTLHATLLLGVALLSASSQVARANLIVNGGFENGLNTWTFTGNGTTDVASISSDTPSGIGNSADLDINQGSGLPWLIQDVPVSAGATLTFSASVREIEPNSPDAWIAAQVWMLSSPSSGAIIASGAAFFSNPSWESKTFNITVPATATIARILFTPQNPSFGVGRGQYRIDDVSLVVPEPSLTALLSSVGLAALWRRLSPRRSLP